MARAWQEFLRSWRLYPGLQLTTLLVLAGTLTLVLVITNWSMNISRVLHLWGEQIPVSVYLTEEAEASTLKIYLESFTELESIQYISKQEALNQLNTGLQGISQELLQGVENPLPASFDVLVKDSLGAEAILQFLPRFREQLEARTEVDEVSFGQTWITDYSAFVAAFKQANFFTLLTLIFGGLLMIGNTIRHSVSRRREDIEILELVGATAHTIRAPFIFEGAVLGALATLFAMIFAGIVHSLMQEVLQSSPALAAVANLIEFYPPWMLLVLVLLGALLGGLGAYMCVRRMAQGWLATERIYAMTDYTR